MNLFIYLSIILLSINPLFYFIALIQLPFGYSWKRAVALITGLQADKRVNEVRHHENAALTTSHGRCNETRASRNVQQTRVKKGNLEAFAGTSGRRTDRRPCVRSYASGGLGRYRVVTVSYCR